MMSHPVRADVLQAIKDFGLLGTWSADCSDYKETMLLVRFTMSSQGRVRIIVGHPDDIVYTSTIESAVQAAGGEISLGIDAGFISPQWHLTLRLKSGALRIWQSSSTTQSPDVANGRDLATGLATPTLYRCISE